MTKELAPDLIALTGDIVDGSVPRLASRIAPLQALASGDRAFFVLGNHDYYSGAAPWTAHFEAVGFRVLRNAHVTIARGAARLLIGGVIDFAARMSDPDARPRPDLATDGNAQPAFRLLLAHNPKIAPLTEQAGFDLQLSGHTHACQFFPWTFVIHLVHGPHAFFAVTGTRANRSAWFERGSAETGRIVAGEWRRTITALTLHADVPHVVGNAAASVVLVGA